MKILSKENFEAIIGHHYTVQIEESDGKFAQQIKKLSEELGLKERERRKVRITEGDVDWDDTREVRIDLETFVKIAKFVEEETNE